MALSEEVTRLEEDKFDKANIAQELGNDPEKIVSQKALVEIFERFELGISLKNYIENNIVPQSYVKGVFNTNNLGNINKNVGDDKYTSSTPIEIELGTKYLALDNYPIKNQYILAVGFYSALPASNTTLTGYFDTSTMTEATATVLDIPEDTRYIVFSMVDGVIPSAYISNEKYITEWFNLKKVDVQNVVKTTVQELSAEEQKQARDNIGMFDFDITKEVSRNLFDKSISTPGYWWNASAGLDAPISNQYTKNYLACSAKIGEEKNITFKTKVANTLCKLYNIYALNVDGDVIETIQLENKYINNLAFTITLPEDTAEIKFNLNMTPENQAIYELMVNEGTEALPYEEYGVSEQSVTIPDLNIDFQEADTVKITLGKHFYAVVGDTLQIFYDSIFEGDWRNKIVEFACPKGRNFPRYFEVTPTSADIGEHDITVIVYDNNGRVIAKETSVLHIAEAVNPASKKNILCVGDSTMEGGAIPIEASRRIKGTTGTATTPTALALNNINFVGRKKNPDNTVGWEGTGGWRYSHYIGAGLTAVRINVANAPDLDMSAVYTVNSFKLQIAEINVTDGVGNVRFLFYYETPYNSSFDSTSTSGTMTKIKGNGQNTIEYTNLTIEKYQPFWNNETNAFDIVTYANTYCGGQVDFICVLLGINDCISTYAFGDVSKALEDAKTFFRNVHAQLPNCKIIASTLPKMSVNGGLAANYTAANQQGKYNANGKNQIVSNFNRMFNALLDEEEFADCLIVSNSHAQFDAENGYPTTTKALNTRVTATEMLQSNGVHPKNEGYWQLSDAMAFRAVICNISS